MNKKIIYGVLIVIAILFIGRMLFVIQHERNFQKCMASLKPGETCESKGWWKIEKGQM